MIHRRKIWLKLPIHTFWLRLAIVITGLNCAQPTQANDSAASLAAGGLVLLQQPWIEMAEETLHITPRSVEVIYRFHNHADTPIETLVAFPLPEVGALSDWGGDSPGLIEDLGGRYLNFETLVDGQPVAMHVEQRARLGGIDVTDDLLRLGVPLIPHDGAAQARLAALPADIRAALRAGLLIDSEGWPAWRLQTTYFWRQVFAPNSDLRVEHRYAPLVGGSVDWPVALWPEGQEPDDAARAWVAKERADYCVDPAIEAQMLAQRRGETGLPPHYFGSTTLGYILSTGANWRGAIGHFRLIIEADHPADYVFACLDGMVRDAPGRITADLRDFTPTHDLDVTFANAYGEGIARP